MTTKTDSLKEIALDLARELKGVDTYISEWTTGTKRKTTWYSAITPGYQDIWSKQWYPRFETKPVKSLEALVNHLLWDAEMSFGGDLHKFTKLAELVNRAEEAIEQWQPEKDKHGVLRNQTVVARGYSQDWHKFKRDVKLDLDKEFSGKSRVLYQDLDVVFDDVKGVWFEKL